MKLSAVAAATLAVILSSVSAQACTGTADNINGNWYCQAVNAISYNNFGTPGTYAKVVSMENGSCSTEPQPYAGSVSPLDEGVSWHFRGPLQLKQFAFYTMNLNEPQNSIDLINHDKRHGHHHLHKNPKERIGSPGEGSGISNRDIGDWVTVTMDDKVVSWQNEYSGGGEVTQTPTPEPTTVQTSSPVTSSQTLGEPAPAGNWGREAYYSAEEQVAEGLVFLNHMGGQDSGVFDLKWGNSLSYAAADITMASAAPEVMADHLIPDNTEVVLMSDRVCQEDCGTVRPGTVAYHGFNGSSKVFLLEFMMPLSGKQGFNQDMPAVWILNAQIPRTIQYGAEACSCWASGCGECDVFEILDPGNTRAKSTFHGNPSGSNMNYFSRPTNSTMKAAVVLDGVNRAGHIVIIPNDTLFGLTLDGSIVTGFVESVVRSSALNAVVDLAS